MDIRNTGRSSKALVFAAVMACSAIGGLGMAAPAAAAPAFRAAPGPTPMMKKSCTTQSNCSYWFGIPVHCTVVTKCTSSE